MSSSVQPKQFMQSSGATDAVWVHLNPYSERPRFRGLIKDTSCEVCIVGAGIAGISTAYELVSRGVQVILLDAREVLSGETGRTSGHLNNDLDDKYTEIAKKHGKDGAKVAAESHGWARDHIGETAKKLGIECEYRKLPAYEFSQYPRGDDRHTKEINELKEEAELAQELGIKAEYRDGLAVRGWDGAVDVRNC
jgi:glycine/D-amino acid oxidase-like deaminating enzyme